MNKFRNSCISEWEGRLTFNKGGRSRSFMTMTMTIWWPRSGVKIYHIVTGVTWDVGMPLTCLFLMENAFFYFKFHWNVFPRVQLTINLHWFRSLFHRQQATVWTNDGQVYWHCYMLLDLNKSIHWHNGHSYVKPIFQSYNDLVNIWWSLISNGRVQLFLWYLINQFLWYFRVSSHSNNNIWLVTSPPWNPGPYDNINHPSEVHLELKYHKISFAFIIHFSSIQIPQTL